MRPSATPARAGRSVATRTIRGLRGLTEKQLASDWVSLTQPGLLRALARPAVKRGSWRALSLPREALPHDLSSSPAWSLPRHRRQAPRRLSKQAPNAPGGESAAWGREIRIRDGRCTTRARGRSEQSLTPILLLWLHQPCVTCKFIAFDLLIAGNEVIISPCSAVDESLPDFAEKAERRARGAVLYLVLITAVLVVMCAAMLWWA